MLIDVTDKDAHFISAICLRWQHKVLQLGANKSNYLKENPTQIIIIVKHLEKLTHKSKVRQMELPQSHPPSYYGKAGGLLCSPRSTASWGFKWDLKKATK